MLLSIVFKNYFLILLFENKIAYVLDESALIEYAHASFLKILHSTAQAYLKTM